MGEGLCSLSESVDIMFTYNRLFEDKHTTMPRCTEALYHFVYIVILLLNDLHYLKLTEVCFRRFRRM